MRFSICLLGLLMAAVGADDVFVYEEPYRKWSQIFVHIPSNLYREEGYSHGTAIFGLPPYGRSLVHTFCYAGSELCDPNVNVDTFIGCPTRETDTTTGVTSSIPFILMVDRGSCSFVTKARNAQNGGASAVIFADNTCLCDDTSCTPNYEGETCETKGTVLGDILGTGSDIVIPSVILSKGDADAMKETLQDNKSIRVEMNFAVDPLDRDGGLVVYELWDRPREPRTQQFHQDMRDIAVALGASASFTPYQMIYDGILSNCHGFNGENMCYNLCTNHGRYCQEDPDGDLDRGISGADVVTESLRRMCIWKLYGNKDKNGAGTPWFWFDYVNYFEFFCSSEAFFTSQTCVGYAYEHARIDGTLITQCMEQDSGGLEGNVINTLLEQALVARRDRGTAYIPSVFVNNAIIPGQVSALNVFTALCAGFTSDMVPAFCNGCLDNLRDSCFEDTISCAAARGYCGNAAPARDHDNSMMDDSRFKSSSDIVKGASFVAMAVAITISLVDILF